MMRKKVLTRTGLHRHVSIVRPVSTAMPSVSTARPVCTTRPSVSTARPICTARPSVSTARPVCTARPNVSTARPVYATRPTYPKMDNVRPRGSCSPIKRSYYTKPAFKPKDLKQDVKTFGVQNTTTAGTRAVVNTGKRKLDTDLKKSRWGNPKILLQDHAMVDSGCSSHMTGNKAYLSDFEDFNGGFMAFGSDPKGGSLRKDKGPTQEYILLPLQPHRTRIPVEDVPPGAHEKPSESSPNKNDVQDSEDAANKESEQDLQDELEKIVTQELTAKDMDDVSRQAFEQEKRRIASQKPSVSTDRPFVSIDRSYVSAARTSIGANAGESSFVYLGGKIPIDASTLPNADLSIDPNMPDLEDAYDTLPNDGIFNGAYDDDDEDVGVVADFNNMDNTIAVSPIPTLRIHKDHPKRQILGDSTSIVQTRGKIQKASSAQQALVEEMQEELLQFKLQKVWVLIDLPYGKKVISTKWVFKNKRDERSNVVKNKARLVAQGFRQEEGIDYDE
ncbi:putative ribonuclease H-like domain-containing protein, partial [Tanacetum coccineum]